jgi:hypothetical protein
MRRTDQYSSKSTKLLKRNWKREYHIRVLKIDELEKKKKLEQGISYQITLKSTKKKEIGTGNIKSEYFETDELIEMKLGEERTSPVFFEIDSQNPCSVG